ncbi:hypothetical protein [Aureimonas sp. AU40]|uniref:hypothetical protein n=1 Tax=Aureimonas sp. AU40 TaxID=1637747 RepID=UPI000780BD5A|nr:hypothetical protein [Aureimonas sp. AU40]
MIALSIAATGRAVEELDRQILTSHGMTPGGMDVVEAYLGAAGGTLPEVRWQSHVDLEDLAANIAFELSDLDRNMMGEGAYRERQLLGILNALAAHGTRHQTIRRIPDSTDRAA